MKSRKSAESIALALLVMLAIPILLAAQEQPNTQKKKAHHRYKLVDLGTFGGPASYLANGFDGILNDHGTAVGWADTATPDPYPGFCSVPDCFVTHAFRSRNGVITDLGTLPGGASSQAFWITANGLIIGNSQSGEIDPLVPGLPEIHAVLWHHGVITDLGTLPEGGYDSAASAANNLGQVVGFAVNTIPDPFSLVGYPAQTRAFLWQHGAMQDIGTLGTGTDAMALFVNDHGQVTGQSYTNSTPNPTTGLPTLDPFLWEKGKMLDLGTLGGTLGSPEAFNNRGHVVGQSNLSGDLASHPFLWTKQGGMKDLGTLGGDNGLTNWINDAGDIVGKADLPGPAPQNHDAVLWTKNGTKKIDLGVLPGDSCSNAYYVNDLGQLVGTSEDVDLCHVPTGQHAFLWENGGPMVDLNTLIPPGSSLQLTFAVAINNRGEIAGFGLPSGCAPEDIEFCGHAYVLLPCNQEGHGCGQHSAGVAVAQTQISAGAKPALYQRSAGVAAANRSSGARNRVRAAMPFWLRLGQVSWPHD